MTAIAAQTVAAGVGIAAGVLIWAGVAKLRRPDSTATALTLVHLPPSRLIARLLGGAEVAIGTAVLAIGGVAATVLLAATYTGFAVVGLRGRGQPDVSCGCFGDRDAPLTTTHVVVNVVFAGAATAAAAFGAPSLPAAAADRPALFVATVVLLATAAGLVAVVLTTVPDLFRTLTPDSSSPRPATAAPTPPEVHQ